MLYVLVCAGNEFALGTAEGEVLYRSPGWDVHFDEKACAIVTVTTEMWDTLRPCCFFARARDRHCSALAAVVALVPASRKPEPAPVPPDHERDLGDREAQPQLVRAMADAALAPPVAPVPGSTREAVAA